MVAAKKLVLVVEDDFDISFLVQEAFRREGYNVEAAVDGDQAIEKACLKRPDAIVLDIGLPQKDGWAVLQYLKSDMKTRTIPVIIHSALGQREDIARGLSLGAVRYLIKPCAPAKIASAVKESLDPKE